MRESEVLSDLIGNVYDAVLTPAQWPAVLGQITKFIPGWSSALFSKDATKAGGVHYDDGVVTPHYKQLYFEKYIKLDPATNMHIFAEIGEPMSTTDLSTIEEFNETRFYKEWGQPQGLIDFIATVLDKTATSVAMLGVFRHLNDGPVDDEARRRMRLIVPHVRRAVLIGNVIELKTAQAAALADTFDGIAAAMFMVDARGRVVHANAAGHAMIAEGDVLRVNGGRLAASDAQGEQALAEVFAMAGNGDEAVGIKGIALPLTGKSGDRYVAHVLPLASGARRQAAASFAAAAAMFVRKATLETPGPLEVIAKTYKLTPTELRVMLAVVEVGGSPEVAEALGIAETTVKTHLRRLFEKTGTRRQADLVKIVAGYSGLPAH